MDEKIREIFGWIATGLTMCFYISPIIPFINVFKGKLSYEDTPAIVVTTSYVNCFCWYIYGDMISSYQIKACNLIGAISSIILVFIYLVYELKKYTLDAILNALIIITGSYAIYRGFTLVIDDDQIIGKICIGTACVVFLSPIQLIYRVIKEKNYILIPIYTAWVSIASTSCWVIYGVFITDLNVIIPNIIGFVLAIVQISIYFNYKIRYPTLGEKQFTSTIGIEKNENEKNIKEESDTIKIDEDLSKEKEKPVKITDKEEN